MCLALYYDSIFRSGAGSSSAIPEPMRVFKQISEGMTLDAALKDALHENAKAINLLISTSPPREKEIEPVPEDQTVLRRHENNVGMSIVLLWILAMSVLFAMFAFPGCIPYFWLWFFGIVVFMRGASPEYKKPA